MRTLIATTTTLALVTAGALIGTSGADATTPAPRKVPTNFAFKASGYGTSVKGGQVTAGSEGTAFQAFGCTNQAGIDKNNYVAEAQLPGAGVAHGVATRLWTTQSKTGVTSTYSRSRTADVQLAQSGAGSLELTAISSLARTWHDAKGFHADTTGTIGGIAFTDPTGQSQQIPIPSPGQSVTVPGLATISVGAGVEQANADNAKAFLDAVRIDVLPTDTTVRIGHARAILESGVQGGLLSGHADAARADALTQYVHVGKTPLALMPCRGTDGKERTKSIASVDLGGNALIHGLSTREVGTQTSTGAEGFERSRVNEVVLGADDLVLNGIVGRVNVLLKSGNLKRSTDGTQSGTVTFQGQQQEFDPGQDVLEIPGVAKLERNIVTRTQHGISVTAMRVTLLDGSGLVLNLGEANLNIKPAAR